MYVFVGMCVCVRALLLANFSNVKPESIIIAMRIEDIFHRLFKPHIPWNEWDWLPSNVQTID